MEILPQPWKTPQGTIPADLPPVAGLIPPLQAWPCLTSQPGPASGCRVTLLGRATFFRGKQLILESYFPKVKSGTVTEQPDKRISQSPWAR